MEFLAPRSFNTNAEHQGDYAVMLAGLLKEHETIIHSLRKNINVSEEKSTNPGTSSFLIQIMTEHETIVGILRRYMSKAIPA